MFSSSNRVVSMKGGRKGGESQEWSGKRDGGKREKGRKPDRQGKNMLLEAGTRDF